MKRFFTGLTGLLSWLVCLSAHGQNNAADNKSLLWSISGKGLHKQSFLFGTIHMICVDDYIWTSKMKQSLDTSEKVCFEMNLDDPNIMQDVALGLIDTSGKKLRDYFSADQYTTIYKYFKDSAGIDLSLFENMKPVALQSVIGATGLNCNNPVSYEDSIMKTALKLNKEITGLEVPQEQLEALATIPVDTVIKQLIDDLAEDKGNDSEYTRLISAYRSQDLPELYRLITTSRELGDDLDAFLDIRNKRWIPRMQQKMAQSSIFFAVGAGHLWGDNGVISLLRKAGYTVKPLH